MSKSQKKTISAIVALLLLFVCAVSVPAAASDMLVYAAMTPTELAYCDIDSAPSEEVRDAILSARKSIIFSKSWCDDGQAFVKHKDGSIEVLPKFDDLFPGWENPVIEEPQSYDEASLPDAAPASHSGRVTYCNDDVYFYKSNSTQMLPHCKAFYVQYKGAIYFKATKIPGTTWNAGITDVTTGKNVVYKMHLEEGEEVGFWRPDYHAVYGARVGSNELPGLGHLIVTQDTGA